VTPAEATINVGESITLTATAYDAGGNALAGRAVSWGTDNPGVASGAANGAEAVVTGIAPGTARASAAIEGRTGTATIRVLPTGGGPVTVCAAIAGASVVANDGQYLGRLTNEFDSESIYNEFGQYGSEFSTTSIYNEFGKYGGEFSALSPFNPFSNTPPVLVKNGQFLAYFTVNEFKTPGVTPAFAGTCSFP
jgi:hypothetical protein